MAGLVVDASVAVKWFIAEERAHDAARLRDLDVDLIAPASVLLEVFHALWSATRRRRLAADFLEQAAAIVPKPFSRLVSIEQLFVPATELVRRLGHPIYDCVYLALAERENAELITADERMLAAARQARIKVRLL